MHTEHGQRAWAHFVENKADEARDEVVAKFLEKATAAPASIAATFAHIDAEFIEKQRLRAVIEKALELDKLEENLATMKEAHHVTMDDSVLIEFDERSNAKSFPLGAEAMALWLTVRNVEKVTVKVFAINTKSYYRDKAAQIQSDMNLDGLCATPQALRLRRRSLATTRRI